MPTLNQSAPAAAPSKASSDSSHWYSYDATAGWQPLYTPEKNYTLRQARVDQAAGMVVVPSVTTIMKALNKPQLTNWLMEQVAEAAYVQHVLPPGVWDKDAFIEQAIDTANNSSKGAMDLGTRIHKAIEDAIAGKDWDAALDEYVQPVLAERRNRLVTQSVQEACLGSTKYGYAGRCDDYSDDGMVIRDYKSRKSKGKKVASYETDPLQLAAYGYARWGNPFFKEGRGEIWGISTTQPGLLTVHEFTGKELIPAFTAFLALCDVWRFTNNFDARVNASGQTRPAESLKP